MNHNFRSVWNHSTGTFVAAPETARSGRGAGSATRRRVRRPSLRLTLLAFAMGLAHAAIAAPPSATQLPTGGIVKAGSATIGAKGNTLTVDQSSSRAVIDWNSFSVGSKGTVDFVQPNAGAVTLNRVVGNEASVIDGAMKANGQVFVLNPNGVLFGKGAKVDTGGLLASTLGMSNADFMAGKSTLANAGKPGSVVNQGRLTAADGGYIALVGNKVSNDGVITARLGTVALAAGDKVTLNFNGTSLVDVTIDRATYDAMVANHQLIVADGGLVKLTASTADSLLNTVVNNTGVIQSRTIANQGGRIFLLGEGGKVEVAGTLDASAPNGGNGGHIETSGAKVVVADGTRITTRAAHGTTGTWLVDPTDFTVAPSGGDITGATLASELANNNVQLQSSAGRAAGSGDINVNDAVSWSAHTLTLTAARNVNINAAMTATGAASLDLEPATANGADAAVAGGIVNVGMDANGNFLGKVDFSGTGTLTIGGQVYTVINSLGANESDTTAGTLQGMQGDLTGHYALGSDIDASSTAGWNSGAGFTPVGNTSNPFGGMFEGLGHAVSGLFFNSPTNSSSGLFGEAQGASGAPIVIRNITLANLGQTCAGGVYCAGLVGDVEGYTTIQNVSVSGLISSQTLTSSGLLVGNLHSSSSSEPFDSNIIHAFASGAISANQALNVGGLVGNVDSGGLSDGHATVSISIVPTASYSGGTSIGGLVGNANAATITDSSATSTITLDSSIPGQADSSTSYTYIGGLVGSFGFVPNMTLSNSHAAVSILSVCSSGTCSIADSFVGGLVGAGEEQLSNSYATGSIALDKDGNLGVGGLVGEQLAGSVTSSHATVSIDAPGGQNSVVGGLIGYAASSTVVDTSYATGSITTGNSSTFVGGLIGGSELLSGGNPNVFTNVYASGAISVGDSSSSIGGLSGSSADTTITNAYTTSAVTAGIGSTAVGGFVGEARSGLVLTSVYASGAIRAGDASSGIGGFIGYADTGTITNAYTTGTVTAGTGSEGVGGFVGEAGGSLLVLTNIYASGAVSAGSGSSDVGGLAGLDGGGETVTGAFWNMTTTGQATSAFGTGMTTAQMQTSANFTGATAANGNVNPGWDLANDWIVYDGHTAPLLRAFMTPLTITAESSTKVYDGSAPVGVVDYSSAVDASHLFGTPTVSGAGRNVGTYATTLSQWSDQQGYAITYVSGTATVTPATLTVSATGGTQVYNGTASANVTLGSNGVSGDQLTLSDLSSTMADKNVGNGKVVSVTGISIAGADAGNYTLSNTSATTTTNVTPATLTVSATGGTQVYNGAASANVALGSNGVSGDQLTLSNTSATMADKNVGNGKAVSVTGISISGADAGNYTLANTSATTTTNVTPATLTVSATGGTQVYDGTANANVTLGSNAILSDHLTLADTSATMADKNVGNGKAVSVAGISIAGADAGNYTLGNVSTVTTTNVTPATLTVSATGGTQIYDGTANANVTLHSNAVSGDQLALSDASATMADKNVGNGKRVVVNGISVAGADAGNYTLANTSATTTTNVVPAVLSVVASVADQPLTNGTNVAVRLSGNIIAGDLVSLSDISATVPDTSIGTDKTVIVHGISASGPDAANYTLASPTVSAKANILAPSVHRKSTRSLGGIVGSASQTRGRARGAPRFDPLSLHFQLGRVDIDDHAEDLDIQTSFGEAARANDELRQWLVADRAATRASFEQRLQELKARFDVELKDRDSALLRARAAEAHNRHLALSLALALTLLMLGSATLLLILRLRAQESSNRLLEQLASNGREMTFGLDPSAVIAALRHQLQDMTSAGTVTVWLQGAAGLERNDVDGLAAANVVLWRDGEVAPDVDRLVARCASTALEIVEPSRSAIAPAHVRRWLRRRRPGTLRVFEPLLAGDEVIGVVQIDFGDGLPYRNRERQIVRTACLYAAIALANIRTAGLLSESQVALEQQHTRDVQAQAEMLRETNGKLEQLAAIGQEITRQLSESGVVDALERSIGGLLQDVGLSVFRSVRDDAGVLVGLKCARGAADDRASPAWVDIDAPASAIARCARERRELPPDDDSSDGGASSAGDPSNAADRPAAVHLPLFAGDDLLGVLVVEGTQDVVFSERDRLMLRSLRAYASVGLANATAYRGLESALGKLDIARDELVRKNTLLENAYEQQREASLTDSLTRLHNRRFLLEHIDGEVGLAWRRHQQRGRGETDALEDGDLIFYIVDIDHFKSVNDQHGHAAGDRVLVQVAQRLRAAARESDFVVRWGGEEFMIVARATSADQASLLAERLRDAVASAPFDLGDGKSLERTCSVGFAGLPFHPEATGVGSWTDIVDLADQALYMAKQGGRNRWVGLAAGSATPSREEFDALKCDVQAALGRGALRLLTASCSPEEASIVDQRRAA